MNGTFQQVECIEQQNGWQGPWTSPEFRVVNHHAFSTISFNIHHFHPWNFLNILMKTSISSGVNHGSSEPFPYSRCVIKSDAEAVASVAKGAIFIAKSGLSRMAWQVIPSGHRPAGRTQQGAMGLVPRFCRSSSPPQINVERCLAMVETYRKFTYHFWQTWDTWNIPTICYPWKWWMQNAQWKELPGPPAGRRTKRLASLVNIKDAVTSRIMTKKVLLSPNLRPAAGCRSLLVKPCGPLKRLAMSSTPDVQKHISGKMVIYHSVLLRPWPLCWSCVPCLSPFLLKSHISVIKNWSYLRYVMAMKGQGLCERVPPNQLLQAGMRLHVGDKDKPF